MILTKKLKIKLSGKNKTHFKKLNYDIKDKKTLEVDVEDLSKGSKYKIKAKCDICESEKEIEYRLYLKSKSKHNIFTCSNRCAYLKNKKTNLENWGVEHYTQTEDWETKTKKTNLKKCGKEWYTQTEDCKNKTKKTNLRKWNSEYTFQSEEIKEKIRKTHLEKRGVDNYSKTKEWKDKTKETNLKKLGVEYPTQSTIIKNKCRETLLKNKNVDHNSKLDSFKEIYYKNYEEILDQRKYKVLNINKEIEIKHVKCNQKFKIKSYLLYYRRKNNKELCTICNPVDIRKSYLEKEFLNFIKENYKDKILINDRMVLGGKELDIYIPDKKLGIEFNGLYWHSELHKDKEYHLNKTLECQSKDIDLVHIWEDDWINKKDIVKSIILNRLGLIKEKIWGRKCEIKEVSSKDTRKFLDENHIQGFSKSTYKLGLYYKGELVSLMTFGWRKTNAKKEFELIRFCNKKGVNVVGSASKLFKYFIKNYDIPNNKIISYADITMFDGDLYHKLGFKEIHLTKPNYFWVVDGVREHRWKFNKQKLIEEGFSKDKTEVQIMQERGYYRIFGCGQKRFHYEF